ncbi:hypothetical protein Tco_1300914, partial [Tanacetum coccineum]
HDYRIPESQGQNELGGQPSTLMNVILVASFLDRIPNEMGST